MLQIVIHNVCVLLKIFARFVQHFYLTRNRGLRHDSIQLNLEYLSVCRVIVEAD